MFRTIFFALACVVATTEGLKLSALATEPTYSPAYLAQVGKGDEKQKMEEFAAEEEASVPDELFIPKVTIKKPATLFKA